LAKASAEIAAAFAPSLSSSSSSSSSSSTASSSFRSSSHYRHQADVGIELNRQPDHQHLIHLSLLVGQSGNSSRTSGNRLNHVLQTIFIRRAISIHFRASANQLYPSRHIHTYRVGSGPKSGIYRSQSLFSSSTASRSVTEGGASDINNTSASGASSYT